MSAGDEVTIAAGQIAMPGYTVAEAKSPLTANHSEREMGSALGKKMC